VFLIWFFNMYPARVLSNFFSVASIIYVYFFLW
jgi:hypothetical protein